MRPYFVRVGQRWQHLWIAGSGAPILLLHGSPNRAMTLRPLIETLSKSFLIIAPDMPGNGYSDPLPESSDHIRGYTGAALALMDNLHIKDFGIYGYRSGSVIAADIAIAAPQRVRGVVCDGYPMWTGAEVAELSKVRSARLTPESSGAHLTQLWSLLIDQNLYFPWHERRARHAVAHDLNDSQPLHDRALEFLDAGSVTPLSNNIWLRDDGEERVHALINSKTPTLCIADAADAMDEHRRRLPKLSALTSAQYQGQDNQHRQIQAFYDLGNMPPLTDGLYLPDSERRYVQPQSANLERDEWLFVEVPRNPASIWLHDIGESHRRGPGSTVRVDLPGHGFTTAAWPGTRAAATELVAETLKALDLNPTDATGRGLGREIAEAFVQTTPTKRQSAAMPDLTPSWEGAHLLRAWHYCRYRSQYTHWQQRGDDQRRAADMPDAQMLQQQTIDLLRAGAQTLNSISAENA